MILCRLRNSLRCYSEVIVSQPLCNSPSLSGRAGHVSSPAHIIDMHRASNEAVARAGPYLGRVTVKSAEAKRIHWPTRWHEQRNPLESCRQSVRDSFTCRHNDHLQAHEPKALVRHRRKHVSVMPKVTFEMQNNGTHMCALCQASHRACAQCAQSGAMVL